MPYRIDAECDLSSRLLASENDVAHAVLLHDGQGERFGLGSYRVAIAVAPFSRELDGRRQLGLCIEDRGIGVAPELRERIFVLFQRGVDRDYDGTGVGLAIVKQVARRHGGDVFVQPRDGGGSEFISWTLGPEDGDELASVPFPEGEA